MPIDLVEQIANAVLYEGYILYPYRASALKNQQRFNFGGLYPPAHRRAQSGADTDTMEFECLVLVSRPDAADCRVECRMRFLHLQAREVFRLSSPAADETAFELVGSLAVDGHVHQTWQEAVERDIVVGLSPAELATRPVVKGFALPAFRRQERLARDDGTVVGRVVCRQNEVCGAITFSTEQLAPDLFKLKVVIHNATAVAEETLPDRGEVLLSTFVSTHAILRVTGGEFVSLLEPPESLRSAAEGCHQRGAWPVLAGAPGQRDQLLASPIILYDYPQVAPESSCDWCDGAEIDEMLALRVMTLTGDEKRAMRDVDCRARAMLERAESLTEEQMLKLHGTLRGLEPRVATPSVSEARSGDHS